MKPQGLFLMVEPVIHLSKKVFLREIETAKELGFSIKEYPEIRMSKSALFTLGNDRGISS
jgi:hypothetical protein